MGDIIMLDEMILCAFELVGQVIHIVPRESEHAYCGMFIPAHYYIVGRNWVSGNTCDHCLAAWHRREGGDDLSTNA